MFEAEMFIKGMRVFECFIISWNLCELLINNDNQTKVKRRLIPFIHFTFGRNSLSFCVSLFALFCFSFQLKIACFWFKFLCKSKQSSQNSEIQDYFCKNWLYFLLTPCFSSRSWINFAYGAPVPGRSLSIKVHVSLTDRLAVSVEFPDVTLFCVE